FVKMLGLDGVFLFGTLGLLLEVGGEEVRRGEVSFDLQLVFELAIGEDELPEVRAGRDGEPTPLDVQQGLLDPRGYPFRLVLLRGAQRLRERPAAESEKDVPVVRLWTLA